MPSKVIHKEGLKNKHTEMRTCIAKIFVIFIFLPFASSILVENDMKVVVDVLNSFNKPSDVLANLCWSDHTKKKLMVSLAESMYPRSVKFVKEVHTKDLVNVENVIFLVDVSCENAPEFLSKGSFRKIFGRPYRWFIMNRPNASVVIPSEIANFEILPDSEVYVANNKNDHYSIDMIYKIKANLNWLIENYGKWTPHGGLVTSFIKEVTAIRRKDLNGEIIVTSTVITDNGTLADFELLRYKTIDSVAKTGYHQMIPLYYFINASRELIFAESWGYWVNGSWTGMLGHLAEEKAELAGLVMYFNEERKTAVEFLSNPTNLAAKFIFREPPLSYQNNLYVLPFKASVWYCLAVFLVLLIMTMYVNALWEARKKTTKKDDETSVLIPNISDVTLFVMSAISQQGSNVELKGTLGRSVILLIFLVFLFMYTAYSASIVVLLQASSNQIRTLSDLLNSKLELGVEDTPYNRYWFSTATDPVRRAIYEKKVAPSGSKPNYFDITEGILQLQKRPFAFNCNLGTAYKLIERYFYEHEKCALQEIAFIQARSPWQACRKGSPYREMFKIGFLRNAEHGLNDRSNRIMYSKKPTCSVRGGSFVSVSLVDSYPIILFLLYGTILSVILLLAEILHYRKTTKKRNLEHDGDVLENN